MKKRIVSIMALSLVVMEAVSLTGCGTRTKATEITIEDGDTIIIEEEDMETEESVDTDDITETEVIGGDTDEVSDFVGAEDENIVLYAEIEEYGEYSVDMFDYVEQPGIINATEDILIYNDEGINVGYIKTGSSVYITEGAEVGGWSRFKNPIANTEYDYLYVKKAFVTDAEELQLNADGMKQGIIDFVLSRSEDASVYTFLNEKTSDMEVYECNIESIYSDKIEYDYWPSEQFVRAFNIFAYETLYVECEEDTDGWITCRIYYKDLIELE